MKPAAQADQRVGRFKPELEGWAGRLFLLFPRSRGVLKQPLPVGSQAVKFPVPIALVLGPVSSGSPPAWPYTLHVPANPSPEHLGGAWGGHPALPQGLQGRAGPTACCWNQHRYRPPQASAPASVACNTDGRVSWCAGTTPSRRPRPSTTSCSRHVQARERNTGAPRDHRLPKPHSIAAPSPYSPKHTQQPQQPLPCPSGSPCATRPPAHPSRACAPCPSHCAGPYGTGFSSTRVILAAMDTYSSSCTRMAMPLCLLLWHVVAVCAPECRTDVRVCAPVLL